MHNKSKNMTNLTGDNMTNFEAVGIAEGIESATEDQQIEAWQHLIDTGLAWSLQGWFGRNAEELINQGICTLIVDHKQEII